MNRKESRKILEITGVAAILFFVPLGYFYNRDTITAKCNSMYYKMFSISDKQYERYLKQQNSQVDFESQKQSESDQEADNENPKN
ncbi:unnamed protein product [Moneuplotes crassus]|uniref:Uncharacterized protein n=1 Tax=Euplotes crassus TaxID=5936 RepID=A0AAD2DA79_EUPCR|nr:unnamed protein product [Moneuplotes crassus]